MKKGTLLSLLLLFAAAIPAVAQKELPRHKKPKQSKLDADVWSLTFNDAMPLQYIQPKEAAAEVEKEAKLKMWSADQKAAKLESQAKGGYLQLTFYRKTIAFANPHQLTFVVQNPDGAELMRYQPESKVPEYLPSSGNFFSVTHVPLAQPLTTGAKVFIIDEGEQYRFEYEVRPL